MSLAKKIEERKKQKIREERNKKAAIATAGIATGAIVGTMAGVLLAPKSGKETIEDVKEQSNKIKEKINDNIKESKSKIKESKSKIKEYLEERKNEKENQDVDVQPVALLENTQSSEETKED